MTLTMNSAPSGASTSTTSPVGAAATAPAAPTAPAGGEKSFWDSLASFLPGLGGIAAEAVGLDPRVAGQTVSQVLSIFGIGGPGKAFTTAIPKDQALSQLQQVVAPHVSDPAFATALGTWLQAAVEPVQAQKAGKAYQPSVDLSKDWFSDAFSSIGNAISGVDWGKVAQVGMQALPFVLSLL